MQYNQELYQEYLETKGKNTQATYSQHIRKRVLLQQLVALPDNFSVTLEASIPLLHGLSILPTFSNISHLQ